MSKIARPLGLVLGLGLMAACSHTYPIPHRTMGSVRAPALVGKTVTVHLTPPGLARQYSGSTNGHSYTITKIYEFIHYAFTRFFSNTTRQLRFVTGNAATGADIELYPEIKLRYGGFLIKKCHVTFSLTAKGSNGAELARASATKSHGFTAMSNGGRACEISLLKAMGQATDAVLARLPTGAPAAPAAPPATSPSAPTTPPARKGQ